MCIYRFGQSSTFDADTVRLVNGCRSEDGACLKTDSSTTVFVVGEPFPTHDNSLVTWGEQNAQVVATVEQG